MHPADCRLDGPESEATRMFTIPTEFNPSPTHVLYQVLCNAGGAFIFASILFIIIITDPFKDVKIFQKFNSLIFVQINSI